MKELLIEELLSEELVRAIEIFEEDVGLVSDDDDFCVEVVVRSITTIAKSEELFCGVPCKRRRCSRAMIK
jgi:hypothetical protein